MAYLKHLWLKHCHLTDKNKNSSQLKIWKELLKAHALECREFCQLVQLMIATSTNMSDLERAYSRLEMIKTKCKDQLKINNLEILILANLQIPVKPPFQCENEVA